MMDHKEPLDNDPTTAAEDATVDAQSAPQSTGPVPIPGSRAVRRRAARELRALVQAMLGTQRVEAKAAERVRDALAFLAAAGSHEELDRGRAVADQLGRRAGDARRAYASVILEMAEIIEAYTPDLAVSEDREPGAGLILPGHLQC